MKRMREQHRILVLILVMSAVASGVGLVAIYTLYRAAFQTQRERLRETVRSRARTIEAIAEFSARHPAQGYEGSDFDAALDQVRTAHARFEGFGTTGEFTLATLRDGSIVFLLQHRHGLERQPEPVPFFSEYAEPMRRALRGESGTLVGLDYRGVQVLAAHEPVSVHRMGIVAKIDLSEVRAPFIRAALLSSGVALAFILLGAILFRGISNPILAKLVKDADDLQRQIAAQRESERALAESEDRYRELYENMSSGVAVFEAVDDGEDFVFRGHNRASRAITETTGGAVVGRRIAEVLPGAKGIDLPDVLRRVWTTGAPERLPASRYEDGRLHRWFEFFVYKLPSGEVVAVYDDVSSRMEAEARILSSIKEKEVLLREIHHRVKNNLQIISSMLNLHRRRLESEESRSALAESHDRINTMAAIHEKLYRSEDFKRIDMAEYIRHISSNLLHAHGVGTEQITLRLDVGTASLDVGQANACGMIINELLSNALEHAFPEGRHGRIDVSLRATGERLELTVQDDGVGLPPGFDPGTSPTLGLELVQAFVEQLDGELQILSSEGAGFRILFATSQEDEDE